MPTRIIDLVPDAETLLAMEPEELGIPLLRYLASTPVYSYRPQQRFKGGNFFLDSTSPALDYPAPYRRQIEEAITAAWMWLEREGFLLPAPGEQDRDWVIVSSRGRVLVENETATAVRHVNLLPRNYLHPTIAGSTLALFARGHYDTVVFEAFRAVEIAVRDAPSLPQAMVGTQLMRAAFNAATGALTDSTQIPAEQQAISDLFAGAIGFFKNPASHRANTVSSAEAAVSIVMFADFLLKFVDERRGRGQAVITP